MEVIYFILGIILVIIILYIKRLHKLHLWKKKKEHALKGEEKAKSFLESHGYKVIDYQYELKYNLLSNGVSKQIKIRPDYIVKKGFKKYIAEIKTGQKVIKAKNISTRRQLLEYYFSSYIYGLLLVDMENKEIKKIEFKNNRVSKLKKNNTILKQIILILLLLLGVSIWQELVLYIIKIKKVIEIFLLIKKRYKVKNEIFTSDFHKNKVDFIVSIGGDGTLIKASKKIINMEVPVIAINMGTLGFLTEIKKEEAFSVIDSVIKKDYDLMERYFLKVIFKNKTYFVLNEVVIAKAGTLSRMIKVSIKEGEIPINTYRSDGLIIASPTGSTAYSMSAGGPIVTPDLNVMIITPISPHTLSNRPIIINGNQNLFAQISEEHNDAHIILDGQKSLSIEKGEELEITLSSKKILLVKPKNRNYYSVLREKLNWGIENVKRIEN